MVSIPPDAVQDLWEKNVPGLGLGRDPERTPMQWDAAPNAGFTTGRPWLPLAADARAVNVASQRDDPTSILTLTRRLLSLRRQSPALSVGAWEALDVAGDVLAYVRSSAASRCLVALNLGSSPQTLTIPAAFVGGHIQLSTYLDHERRRVENALELRADEGVIIAPP
jgi:alpha-glucosidase